MSEIVFITPNFGGFVREEPVGTLLLTSILRNSGFHADILQFHHFGDVSQFDLFISTAIEKIMDKKPRVISFYTRCDTYHISLKIAEKVKEHIPNAYVVFAGPQADLSAIDTIREIPYVDYICCGEGELTVVPFFASLIEGNPNHAIKGLVYREGDRIIKNPRPDLIENLDSLPAIDYSLLNYSNEGLTTRAKTLFPVDVGRGCPFACTFCSTKTFWARKYRLKSAEKIISEIKHIHETYGVTSFNFEHDMFTMNREKVIKICKMLKQLDFPITWRCSARVDCIDDELIDIMSDAGMNILFVGIESGSPRMQKLINKNLKLDDVPRKLRYIANKGVKVTASFIFGFPDETEQDFAQTMQLATELCTINGVYVLSNLCTFFPGTELTDRYYDQLEEASTYATITGSVAVLECQELIQKHPTIFPHFREFKTELREKIKYYPQMLNNWQSLHPIYGYIQEKYYKDCICNILYDFSDLNKSLLEAGVGGLELMQNDHLLDKFADDEHYEKIKEVAKFLVWKNTARAGDVEVFGIDAAAVLKGTSIVELRKTITAVYCQLNQNGQTTFRVVSISEK